MTLLPYALEILLECVLLAFLLQGPFRKYPTFFLYILIQVVTHSLVTAAYFIAGFKTAIYRNLYWSDELAGELLLFLVVITLSYEALKGSVVRPQAAKVFSVIGIAAFVLPIVMLRDHHSKLYGYFNTQWFTHVSQIFDFAAAIMNLVLWAALLSNRRRDPQLVTLSIGVGIVTSSAAIGWGAWQLLPAGYYWAVDIFMETARIAGVLLWCRVFRPKTRRPSNATPPNALTTPS